MKINHKHHNKVGNINMKQTMRKIFFKNGRGPSAPSPL